MEDAIKIIRDYCMRCDVVTPPHFAEGLSRQLEGGQFTIVKTNGFGLKKSLDVHSGADIIAAPDKLLVPMNDMLEIKIRRI